MTSFVANEQFMNGYKASVKRKTRALVKLKEKAKKNVNDFR